MEKENKKTTEIPFGANDSELYEFEYTIPEGYEAEIKDGKVIMKKKESEDEKIRQFLVNEVLGHIGMLDIEGDRVVNNTRNELWKKALSYLEKLKEQKPAEWNEGETKVLDSIIDDYEKAAKSFCGYNGKIMLLKAIRNGEYDLPKQEWSEEVENMFDSIIHDVMTLHNAKNLEELKNKVNWLKSLRPQPHWKPSEEQIDTVVK